MWPHCASTESDLLLNWDCVRGVTLGTASAVLLVICVLATLRIFVVFVRTRWYGLNLLMLILGTVQALFLTIKYLIDRNQKLTFAAGYARGVQSLITCANYAKTAAETGTDPEIFSRYYFPLLGVVVFYLTIIFLVAMGRKQDLCFHPRWLVMSVSQLMVVALFSIPGLKVMRKLAGAMQWHHVYADASIRDEIDVALQQKALRTLLIFNALGASAQVVLDVWLKFVYEDPEQCVVFETAFEEIVRIFLKLIAYHLPITATVFVYYWLPRTRIQDGHVDEQGRAHAASLGMDEAFSTDLLERT
mmetsp:Transcript_17025/g.33280  ORF Transcript_17025/g.33280 Transcript_17025/m.33280 type:complete len:303 (-) Transcript_17025:438-1346(-)|eukprot:CAMPEP_0171520156 /NCGR_PEP_ID=MMETSP0959-20130129/6336_1 /TAXON_ID=87120 /ORGANISM="Aurantiochytrium limacinum, Strain ATCCMYA-1381" /LENGTH=302 /DNA_ID=CAMNT_0012059747 /DNA_START=97 /DNA_END=1005 /DNA_ORIENTATION=+